jgi:hypothetical protein
VPNLNPAPLPENKTLKISHSVFSNLLLGHAGVFFKLSFNMGQPIARCFSENNGCGKKDWGGGFLFLVLG